MKCKRKIQMRSINEFNSITPFLPWHKFVIAFYLFPPLCFARTERISQGETHPLANSLPVFSSTEDFKRPLRFSERCKSRRIGQSIASIKKKNTNPPSRWRRPLRKPGSTYTLKIARVAIRTPFFTTASGRENAMNRNIFQGVRRKK